MYSLKVKLKSIVIANEASTVVGIARPNIKCFERLQCVRSVKSSLDRTIIILNAICLIRLSLTYFFLLQDVDRIHASIILLPIRNSWKSSCISCIQFHKRVYFISSNNTAQKRPVQQYMINETILLMSTSLSLASLPSRLLAGEKLMSANGF